MTILALDASSVSCSACVSENSKILAEAFINTALTHSVTLLANIKKVLEQSEKTIEDIDLIAVTAGPGSFTGVKIGVACAKGLAFERDIPCFAVSSLAAAAENVSLFSGTVIAVMDARRKSFYNAVFKNGKRVCADRQSSVDELLASLPDAEPVVAVGDGAELFVRLCSERGRENIKAAPSFLRYIKASAVAELALRGDCKKRDCVSLAPVYLRAPQAERERLERENAAKQN